MWEASIPVQQEACSRLRSTKMQITHISVLYFFLLLVSLNTCACLLARSKFQDLIKKWILKNTHSPLKASKCSCFSDVSLFPFCFQPLIDPFSILYPAGGWSSLSRDLPPSAISSRSSRDTEAIPSQPQGIITSAYPGSVPEVSEQAHKRHPIQSHLSWLIS